MVAAGVGVMALTGGAANVIGSGLIGAGIGGLAYDIKAAATGNGAHTDWGKWGIQVGIGAATGLLTGGIAVGAGSVLGTAGVQGVSKIVAMAGIMAVTGSGLGMASTVINNALSGTSLTSGLGMAGVSGGITGFMGGGFSSTIAAMEEVGASAGAAGAAAGGAEAPSPIELDELPAGPKEEAPVRANDNSGVVARPGPKPYWRNLVNRSRMVEGPDWAKEIRQSCPRLIFGSVRSVLMSSMPDFAKVF